MTTKQSARPESFIARSLSFKVGFLATLIMLVVLVVFSAVFIVSERQRSEENILENGKTFSTFSAKSIYDNYAQFYTHPQPEDFQNFKVRVQAIMEFNSDIKAVSLHGLSGRMLFASSEFTDGKYSGPARKIDDTQTIAALSGETISNRSITVDGQQMTEIVVPLNEASGGHILSMRYLLSYDSLGARMQETYQRSAIVALTLMFCGVLAAILMSRRLTRPITRLTRVAQAIQGGNFDARAPETSKDELGTLSRALNNMAGELKGYYEDLEAKVGQRTQALQQAEGKLRENAQKQEALLSSIGDGVIATDQNGVVVLINKIAEDMLGVKRDDVAGKPYADMWHLMSERRPVAQADHPVYSALHTGISTRSSNFTLMVAGGESTEDSFIPVSVSVSPATLGGSIIGAIAVWRDITHEKEVDRMKTEFISLASHQLRTPLSAIKWFAEMLLAGDAGKLNDEQTEFARNVADSTERMIELVSALLNISRIESGRMMVDPRPTEVKHLIDGIVKDVSDKVEQKKQKLVVEMDQSLPSIPLDERLISQVYINLLTNAIKYTSSEGTITLKIEQKDGKLVSSVKDTGYGIPKAEQHKVFQKFFRAQNAAKVITDGTGLGLYLIKAIVDSSGGKIWFESEEGKGTTFWFSLPMAGMKKHEGEVTIDS